MPMYWIMSYCSRIYSLIKGWGIARCKYKKLAKRILIFLFVAKMKFKANHLKGDLSNKKKEILYVKEEYKLKFSMIIY